MRRLMLLLLCFMALTPLWPLSPLNAQVLYPQEGGDDMDAGGNPTALVPSTPRPAPQATDLQVRMNGLEKLVRNLTGEVEKLQYRNSQLEQQLKKDSADQEIRFQQIETRIGQTEAGLRTLSTQQQQAAAAAAAAPPLAQPPATLTTPPAAVAPAANPTISAPAATVPEAKAGNIIGTIARNLKNGDNADAAKPEAGAQADYDNAFKAMRAAHYDEAEQAFRNFLKNYPRHRLTENAKYWLAETYYARSKFSEAAVAFAEGYEKFPKGSKAADNLFKLAISLGALNKKPDACATLAELEKSFPNSTAVTRNHVAEEKKRFACS